MSGDQPGAVDDLCDGFKRGEKSQTLLGVTGSGKTFTMANVIRRLGKRTLVLAHNKTLAAQLYAEFKSFFPDNAVSYFVSYYDYYRPEAYVVSSDTYVEKESSVNDEIDRLRHHATSSLLERKDSIVIASVSCIYGIGSPDEYSQQRITLFAGEEFGRENLLERLVAIQYSRNDFDPVRGDFRVRGESVEIFLPGEEQYALRVEFFDDEIESLVIFDPLRRKTLKTLKKAVVYPKSHFVVGRERLERAVVSIKEELREQLAWLKNSDKLVEHQRLRDRTLLDLEMLEEMGFCNGIENYSRHMTGLPPGQPPPTLIDFFKGDFLMIVDESHMTIPQVGAMYRGDRSRKENLVNYGFRLPSALDNRPLKFDEFEQKLDQVLFVSATPGDYELEKTKGEFVEQIIRPTGLLDPVVEMKDSTIQVDDLLVESKKTIAKGFRVLVTTLTKKSAEDLTDYYKSIGMKVKYLHSDIDTLERMEIIRDLRKGLFDILVGINLLREGLDLPEVALVGIIDADKEGFLRSERSLIQTIGRAARNVEGRVILYALRKTGSMERAMAETSRRRGIQAQFNREKGIVPAGISKKIDGGIIDTLRRSRPDKVSRSRKGKEREKLTPDGLEKSIALLKKEMKQAARHLEFEEAAKIRDEIKKLEELRLMA